MRILKTALFLVALFAPVAGVQAQTVETTISYPTGVSGIAVDYIKGHAYVLLPNYFDTGLSALQVLTVNGTVVATYSVPVSNAITVNVVTGTVYIGGSVPSAADPTIPQLEVMALNPKTGTITATIPVSTTLGLGIVALAADPITNEIFAADGSDNAIVVINGKSNKLSSLVGLNAQTPAAIAVNFVTGKVFATLDDFDVDGNPVGAVAILTEKSGAVNYASYRTSPAGIAVDPVLNRGYVNDALFPGNTGALNAKGAMLANTVVGDDPQGVDVDWLTGLISVANEADGSVSRISAFTNAVINTVTPASGDVQSVAVDQAQNKVFVAGGASVTIMSKF